MKQKFASRWWQRANLNKSLLASALFFCLSGLALAQPEYPGDGARADIPDAVMQQVIGRILVKTFKPAPEPKTIEFLSSGIKRSWLPFIRNIKFRLVSDDRTGREFYFFTKPKIQHKTYTIGFGFGNPKCDATGDSWSFRLSKQKVTRLWKNGGFGSGCSGSMDHGTASSSVNVYSTATRKVALRSLAPINWLLFPHKPNYPGASC